MQRLLALLKIAYVSFIALILANINWFNKHGLKKVFTYSGISLIAFCILFVFSMKLNFSATFETFHMLFFSGNYNFPATSKLLQLFPGGFFFAAGKRILLNSFMIGIGFLGFGYLVPKKI